jgi:hypothetical protein
MKTLLITILCLLWTFHVQGVGVSKEDAATLDDATLPNAANKVHSRISEVTNDNMPNHTQLIRVHWVITSDVWLWTFKLRFNYFDEKHSLITTEAEWVALPKVKGGLFHMEADGFFNIAPHQPLDDWHELTTSTDQAGKIKGVTVTVEKAFQPN